MAAADRPTLLVTGGAGYIGSHVCQAAASAGYLPVAFDDMSSGHSWAVKWGPLEPGDIADFARVAAVVERWRPVAAIHLAGLIVSSESTVDPARYYQCNVAGTLTLLEAIRQSARPGQAPALVFSSSAAVYGEPQTTPISESHPIRPLSPYGASKAMVERMLQDFASAYGMRSVALRYFNAAGANESDGIGEAHPLESHLIPLAISAAANGALPLTIYGEDYPTADGTCIRDYVHVDDLARAHIQAVDFSLEKSGAYVFNLGSGKGVSVRELIAAVGEIGGRSVPTRVATRRPGDPAILLADIERARRDLGWQPSRSDLRSIVTSARAWHRLLQGGGVQTAAQ